jgi:hypothetical protein
MVSIGSRQELVCARILSGKAVMAARSVCKTKESKRYDERRASHVLSKRANPELAVDRHVLKVRLH